MKKPMAILFRMFHFRKGLLRLPIGYHTIKESITTLIEGVAMEKKLGILGGMGPLATANFYEEIIQSTKVEKDQDHIDLIISSHATIPDRTSVILQGKSRDDVLTKVQEDIRLFEFAKVDAIAIPCNTFHYFYDDVQKMTSIPIFHMVRLTLQRAKELGIHRLTIFSTTGTKHGQVYQKQASNMGIHLVETSLEDDKTIMSIIYDIKKRGIRTDERMENLLKKYFNLSEGIVLACTELSCLHLPPHYQDRLFDPVKILAEHTVLYCGRELSK